MTTVAPRRRNARFRSGKLAAPEVSFPLQVPISSLNLNFVQAEPDSVIFDDRANGEIPQMYCRVEIEYSKFGVEDFDFGCISFYFATR